MGWAFGALALVGLALVGASAALVRYFGADARNKTRELGEARGEIERLRGIVADREQQNEALEVALRHALDARPTLGGLQHMALEAGADPGAAAEAVAAVRVPEG